MTKLFYGIDPSFVGFGLSEINLENKVIWFREFSVDVKHGAFAEITEAAVLMEHILDEKTNFMSSEVGMEIPPVSGMYAVKLWALDSRVYDHVSSEANNVWLFNVPYLKFINGKANSKKDTMKMIDDILDVFKSNKFEIIQDLKDKRGKDRKLTSNECDSFLYCIRVFVKYSLENGVNGEIVQEILNVNDKFSIEKETKLGKKID